MSKNKKRLIKTIVALALFIPAFILYLIFKDKGKYVWFAMFSLIYLIAGYDILYKAVRNILHGKVFDENFLMAIASLGALILGEYTEAVAVMIFYQVGECFQSYAVGKSRASISKLMDIRPDVARVIRNGIEEEVFPDEVSVGEIITVRAGDKIPLDGIVIEGNCHLNTSALTGESRPISVVVGDRVLSGTVCLDGKLMIEVQKEFYDGTVSKILDMVENASTKKAKVENFISVFAKYYTPCVVFSAIALAIIPSLFTGNWQEWTVRALTFLVVSCPCALVISVPLSFFGGIGGAGNKGILIKGANYVEQISKANVFVFDKTGTLTKGKFSVVGVYPEEKREEILKYAYVCEKNSNHPIAKAIVEECVPKNADGYEIEEIAGKGVIAKNKTERILCGNLSLLSSENVDVGEVQNLIQQNSLENKTCAYIAINGQFLGIIAVADTVREDAKACVSNLKKQGYKVYMLTGDGEQSARFVAEEVGVDNYFYGLLPQDKMQRIEEIIANKQKGDVVAFIGDGINDAPVIMRADVGVSMGGVGSDSAIEASDVVLMYDKPSAIVTAKKIAQKTMRIVRQNVIFALTIKLSALILSAFGIGGMWYAVFADVGVSVLAILNAMRAMRNKDF
ncbi:MAG: heavy metal translocating P-type ATPase [Clostridiales bacterium]|nr:heavy metal translocating P-type ATPase [Clostridiales bacterium]